eukprot:6410712-Amphidinium_carterae.1
MFEEFVIDSGYPLCDRWGHSHVWPPAWLLHAFLIRSLKCAWRQVEVRKYVDDMVLIIENLCFACRQALASLKSVIGASIDALKSVVICNGSCDQAQALEGLAGLCFGPVYD